MKKLFKIKYNLMNSFDKNIYEQKAANNLIAENLDRIISLSQDSPNSYDITQISQEIASIMETKQEENYELKASLEYSFKDITKEFKTYSIFNSLATTFDEAGNYIINYFNDADQENCSCFAPILGFLNMQNNE